jgi:hypothetical protein
VACEIARRGAAGPSHFPLFADFYTVNWVCAAANGGIVDYWMKSLGSHRVSHITKIRESTRASNLEPIKQPCGTVKSRDAKLLDLISRREMYTFLYPLDACHPDPPAIFPGIVYPNRTNS